MTPAERALKAKQVVLELLNDCSDAELIDTLQLLRGLIADYEGPIRNRLAAAQLHEHYSVSGNPADEMIRDAIQSRHS